MDPPLDYSAATRRSPDRPIHTVTCLHCPMSLLGSENKAEPAAHHSSITTTDIVGEKNIKKGKRD